MRLSDQFPRWVPRLIYANELLRPPETINLRCPFLCAGEATAVWFSVSGSWARLHMLTLYS